jgi:hypothetical protein
LNSSTLAQEILSPIILWLCPAFWSRNMTMHLVLSAFTSRPIYLLATIKVSAFSFIVCMLPPNMLSSDWFGGLSTADVFLELVLIMGCYLEDYHACVGTWAARTIWRAQGRNINGHVRSYLFFLIPSLPLCYDDYFY